MKKFFIYLLLISPFAKAIDPYPKNTAIDVTSYIFQLEVNDTTDVIAGKASVSIFFKKSIAEFDLTLPPKMLRAKEWKRWRFY